MKEETDPVCLDDVRLPTPTEKQRLLHDFNDVAEPEHSGLPVDCFKSWVQCRPDAIAVRTMDQSISYRALDQLSDRLAAQLRRRFGVRLGDPVALLMDRGPSVHLAVLAIMKAGAVYMPLTWETPRERRAIMLAQADCRLVLTDDVARDPGLPASITRVIVRPHQLADADAEELKTQAQTATDGDFPAYIIFTSGSTGRPKGVQIPYAALANRIHWMNQRYPLTANDVILHKTPLTFDVSLWELFWWAMYGGTVTPLPAGAEKTAGVPAETIAAQGATHLHFVPSILDAFLNELTDRNRIKNLARLKRVFVSGEALSGELVQRFNAAVPYASLHNLYGPTEAAVDVTAYDCPPDMATEAPPIGRPTGNNRLYVLHPSSLEPTPMNQPGELYIGGVQLATGYIGRPDLTATAFIPNPFAQGSRLYRTGDLAAWNEAGELLFLGRVDNQIKIRGQRVEPDEVAVALERHSAIHRAVVMTAGADEPSLTAWLQTSDEPTIQTIRSHLARSLPDFMIPTHFVLVDSFPLTDHGKLDREALSTITGPAPTSETARIQPRSETEKHLAAIWAEVLGLKDIGVNHSFFELGGHSLKAARVTARIRVSLGKQIEPVEVLESGTIARLAELLDQRPYLDQAITIPRTMVQDTYPLSHTQKRLWLIDRLTPGSAAYNMARGYYWPKRPNKRLVKHCLAMIVARHESLRTNFIEQAGKPRQRIHKTKRIPFESIDVRDAADPMAALRARALDAVTRPFDLQKDALIRATLIQHQAQGAVLLITMHHIVGDGWSWELFADELHACYQAEKAGEKAPLQPLPIQYRDFAVWQATRDFSAAAAYWRETLAGASDTIQLPYDYKEQNRDGEGATINRRLDVDTLKALETLAGRKGTTLANLMLAAAHLTLFLVTDQADQVIGLSSAGRDHPDLDALIGFFVNPLPIRVRLNESQTFAALLTLVHQSIAAAQAHQHAPYDLPTDSQTVGKFNVSFAFQNYENIHSTRNDAGPRFFAPWREAESLSRSAKFDLTFFAWPREDGLHLELEYRADRFRRETAAQFQDLLTQIAQRLVTEGADQPLSAYRPRDTPALSRELNRTDRAFPSETTLHAQISGLTANQPDAVALIVEGRQVSRAALETEANRLAHFLSSRGAAPGTRIALSLHTCEALVTCVLACLKTGAAFVPLNPDDPLERSARLIDDCQAKILLIGADQITRGHTLLWQNAGLETLYLVDTTSPPLEIAEPDNSLSDQALWDYVGEKAVDPITGGGWVSSYTGRDFSAKEMTEYAANARDKLKPLLGPTSRVLEIGCASGITLFEIAPLVGSYTGIDHSPKILAKTADTCRKRGLDNITLLEMKAAQIAALEGPFDLIILNSVVHCFNGLNALYDVLKTAVDLMADQGVIFLGDVMDLARKRDLIASIQAFQAEHAHQSDAAKTDWSQELFVHRDYLKDLPHGLPAIQSVAISDKQHTIANELTRFRYDALLTIDKRRPLPAADMPRKQVFSAAVLQHMPDTAPKERAAPESPAYLIFTSGTTARPKGVVISHRALMNYAWWAAGFFFGETPISMPLFTSPAFDFTLTSIFVPLLRGGVIHVFKTKQVDQLLREVFAGHCSAIKLTPSHVSMLKLLDLDRTTINTAILGGEKLMDQHIRTLRDLNPAMRIYNEYGPTEATVGCTAALVDEGSVTIGRPAANVHVYVMDGTLQPVQAGLAGELVVAGAGLASGYWRDPRQTARLFVPNPNGEGARLYRTGDRVRLRADGLLVFEGRIDAQLKLRGYRVDPAEIEAVLEDHPGITKAVVRLVGEGELAVYWTGSAGGQQVRPYLNAGLPAYMMPAHHIHLKAWPLTANGKLDRNALPDPGAMTAAKQSPARDELETRLQRLWCEILHKSGIGIHDNFFELGGHSLKATRLAAAIHQTFSVQIQLGDIFQQPTIEGMAHCIRQKDPSAFIPIEPAPIQADYPLSHAQRRLWVLHHLEARPIAYNMPNAFLLQGDVDAEALKRACRKLIARHEATRTVFLTINGEPRQKILADAALDFQVIDLRDETDPRATGHDLAVEDAETPFDLERGPLIRFRLMRLETQTYVFTMNMHHIIGDGWSISVILDELAALFAAELGKGPQPQPPPRVQYKDYTLWQERLLADAERHRDYWLETLAGEPPVLDLPTDFPRPREQTYRGRTQRSFLSPELTAHLNGLGTERGASLFITLTALCGALLYRYSLQTELPLGTPVAGRPHRDLDRQVGFYSNTLALRLKVEPKETFSLLLEQTRRLLTRAFDHQLYPFDKLVHELNVPRDAARSPLFDVMIVFQNEEELALRLDGLRVAPFDITSRVCKFDLVFYFLERDGRLRFELEYNTRLFKSQRIERMTEHLQRLAESAASRSAEPLGRMQMLGDAEAHHLLVTLNQTQVDYPRDGTLPGMFDLQVKRVPDGVAAVHNREHITYSELSRQARAYGLRLRDGHGIGPGDVVAVGLPSGIPRLIAMLAVTRLGGIVFLVDPALPAERKTLLLKASRPKHFIARQDESRVRTRRPVEIESPVMAQAQEPVQLIFTSGSTGRPKAVAPSHRAVLNVLLWFRDYFQLDERHAIPQKTVVSFVDAMTELWLPLAATGGALHLLDRDETARDGTLLLEWLQRIRPAILQMAPSVLRAFHWEGAKLKGLKALIFSGEVLRRSVAAPYPVYNLYGSSESSAAATCYAIPQASDETPVPIGTPIHNTRVLILSPELALCPVGVPGEIHLGGDAVVNGYLDYDAHEAKRFVKDPFRAEGSLYATGDLGVWRDDGMLQFLGRRDHQVKIRGHRIECGEVEHALERHPHIEKAAVTVIGDSERELVAYITVNRGLKQDTVRRFLLKHLPETMVPGIIVLLDHMPLTASGKIDRKALPFLSLSASEQRAEPQPPRTRLEAFFVRMWAEILERGSIGIHDDFFQLGGHSLKATRFIARVHQATGVRLHLIDLFQSPTIHGLAQRVEMGEADGVYGAIPRLAEAPDYPVSHAQHRLWLLHHLEPAAAYNIHKLLRIEGRLNSAALRMAFLALVHRHEVLRTRFLETEAGLRQQITSAGNAAWLEIDLVDAADGEQLAHGILARAAAFPFDLAKGDLIRGHLIYIDDAHALLGLTIHHIACDGWSLRLMFEELAAYYALFAGERRRAEVAPDPVQYKDYAVWSNALIAGGLGTRQADYWRARLKAPLTVLDLPTSRPRPARKTYRGDVFRASVPAETWQRIRAFSLAQRTTPFTVLQTAAKILFQRYSGQEEIITGIASAGREHPRLAHSLGLFVNTLATRDSLEPDESFIAIMKRVRQTLLEAYDNGFYPFDKLVETLQAPRELSRSPVFDVMLVYHNEPPPAPRFHGADTAFLDTAAHFVRYDLTIHFVDDGADLKLEVEYDRHLFEPAWIAQMVQRLQRLSERAAQQPDAPVRELDLLNETERENLLAAFSRDLTEAPPHEETVLDVIARHSQASPHRIAVSGPHGAWNYRVLDRQAERFSAVLASRGLLPGAVICVALKPSIERIAVVLGILKFGGVYMPLDVDRPIAQLQAMLNRGQPHVVVVDPDGESVVRLLQAQKTTPVNMVFHVSDGLQVTVENRGNWHAGNTPGRRAVQPQRRAGYLFFTSGSTGQPKAFLGTLDGLSHFVFWQIRTFGEGAAQRVGEMVRHMFDASLRDIFTPLCAGGTLFIPPRRARIDMAACMDWFDQQCLTMLHLVPTLLRAITREAAAMGTDRTLRHLRYLFVSGEMFYAADARNWHARFGGHTRFVNFYGVSEATMIQVYKPIEVLPEQGPLPAGRPIANAAILILDKQRPVAPGEVGEVYIGTRFLAKGYYRDRKAGRRVFVPTPFKDPPVRQLFRTGDLGRINPNGDLELLGRVDQRVKLRGMLVACDTVADRLTAHPQVADAIVRDLEIPGSGPELVAWLQCLGSVDTAALQQSLAEELPSHMVPGWFVTLPAFPLTATGKVDLRSLPHPRECEPRPEAPEPPRDLLETQLERAWCKVLKRDRIGVQENFFALGGQSITAMHLVAEIQRDMVLDLEPVDVFNAPTIAQMAGLLRRGELARLLPIPVAGERTAYPLSPAQRRLWLLGNLHPSAYNMQWCYRLSGALDVSRLSQAFTTLGRRHAVLRTVYRLEGAALVQRIKAEPVRLPVLVDLGGLGEVEARVQAIAGSALATPFRLDVDTEPRVQLLRLGPAEFFLCITLHHIGFDGWSMANLTRELSALYRALLAGRSNPLEPTAIDYVDYAVWCHERLASVEMERHWNYWRKRLTPPPEPLALPYDFTPPREPAMTGGSLERVLDGALYGELKALGHSERTTLFVLLCALTQTLFHRYTHQRDMVFGVPVAGRNHPMTQSLLGCFVNTLVLRNEVDPRMGFRSLLKACGARMGEALAHQEMPFDSLVERLRAEQVDSGGPLFNVMVVLQNHPDPRLDLPGVRAVSAASLGGTSKFDLTLTFREAAHGLRLEVEYSSELFRAATVERLTAHFQQLALAVTQDKDRTVAELEMLEPQEQVMLLETFNRNGARVQPEGVTLPQRFLDQARRTPDRTAFTYEGLALSYAGLAALAVGLARELRASHGVGPEQFIGVLLPAGPAFVIAVLAIQMAGGAYLPLDPATPGERLAFMLGESGCRLCFAAEADRHVLPAEMTTIDYDPAVGVGVGELSFSPPAGLFDLNAAYLIYTSGTQGRPKGVCGTHRGVNNLVKAMNHLAYRHDEAPLREAFVEPTIFDASVQQIYATLLEGHTLMGMPDGVKQDAEQLNRFLLLRGIEILDMTPGHFSALLDAGLAYMRGLKLRHIMLGADVVPPELLAAFYRTGHYPQVRFSNTYGPTENTVESVCSFIQAPFEPSHESLPLGEPLHGVVAYILDPSFRPVPVGVRGELVIGGRNLARGYQQRPAETAERFVPSPYGEGARLYRSGDIASWLANGEILFHGRKDSQVKIRGFRVECGEVERALRRQADIQQAVVGTVKGANGGRELVAYVTPVNGMARGGGVNGGDLRDRLAALLPSYMLPSYYLMVPSIPLTPNGKIDFAALPDPRDEDGAGERVAPANDLERQLVGVWREVLGGRLIGVTDDFFLAGGHSLAAMALVTKLSDALQVKLPITAVYEARTIRALARVIETVR